MPRADNAQLNIRSAYARNRARDGETTAALTALGWRPLTVWECELRDEAALARRLATDLG